MRMKKTRTNNRTTRLAYNFYAPRQCIIGAAGRPEGLYLPLLTRIQARLQMNGHFK